MQEIAKLRRDVARLQRSSAKLQREFKALLSQFKKQLEVRDGHKARRNQVYKEILAL
jgi:hypothetical protein